MNVIDQRWQFNP